MSKTKVRTICIDTLTAIQERELVNEKKKPGHDQWRDYGVTVVKFVDTLKILGFEVVLVLGEPGTGKSTGMKTLPEGTNIWYNADYKNPTWKGGRANYGKIASPKAPFHMLPQSYQEIIDHLKKGLDAGMFEEERIAFVTGHTETYRSGKETRVRLKTLGQLANKMQVEGKMEVVLYSKVVENDETGNNEFVLYTQNDGTNTARSNEGMLEGIIPNDYNDIVNKMLEY